MSLGPATTLAGARLCHPVPTPATVGAGSGSVTSDPMEEGTMPGGDSLVTGRSCLRHRLIKYLVVSQHSSTRLPADLLSGWMRSGCASRCFEFLYDLHTMLLQPSLMRLPVNLRLVHRYPRSSLFRRRQAYPARNLARVRRIYLQAACPPCRAGAGAV